MKDSVKVGTKVGIAVFVGKAVGASVGFTAGLVVGEAVPQALRINPTKMIITGENFSISVLSLNWVWSPLYGVLSITEKRLNKNLNA
ncbi:MAG: hypothetical protein Phog2KO_30920 [Phototrophicaceae bacterium]